MRCLHCYLCYSLPSGDAPFLHSAALCGDHEGTLLHEGTYRYMYMFPPEGTYTMSLYMYMFPPEGTCTGSTSLLQVVQFLKQHYNLLGNSYYMCALDH